MSGNNNKLASNIKVLRQEARLSIEEFAEKAGVSVDTVKAWENGTSKPYTKDLMIICPILRIHEDDILERDIASERMEATKRMKHSNVRSNYNWYYGSRRKIIFYLLPVIIIPVLFLLTYLVVTSTSSFEELIAFYESQKIEVNFMIKYYYIVYPYIASGICASVFIIIELIKKFGRYFRVWYIYLIISFASVILAILLLMLIPYYIYCLYQLFIKRGKN